MQGRAGKIAEGNLAFFETFDDDALHCLIEEIASMLEFGGV